MPLHPGENGLSTAPGHEFVEEVLPQFAVGDRLALAVFPAT